MSVAREHADWLSLVEVSGPFLSIPVLMDAFPQGLDAHDPEHARQLRIAFGEWEENQLSKRPDPAIHQAWIRFVFSETLEFNHEVLLEGQSIPPGLEARVSEHHEILRPDFTAVTPKGLPNGGKARLLIQAYPQEQDLEKPIKGRRWKAFPSTRMMELLHAADVPLGLVTNGERWMLVYAPRGETTGYVSWYATLWLEEKITLQAFRSLLSARRFFGVAENETLEALLAESAKNQQEVTDKLGYQVRRAVETLVQALDKADRDRNRELLADIPETVLYEAALTVMMRLVFLFSAEERGLLLLGTQMYDQHYAVTTLCDQLRTIADQHGEEILEHRHDAWCRLLATFRAVHGGVQHDDLRLPPYGSHLFDPDCYPFLEGRQAGTTWRTSTARPLPINNRTALHLLESLQFLEVDVGRGAGKEKRRLSFRALDIEQIGHVYEGLLDHTAKRASEPFVSLKGKKGDEPEIPLSVLEGLRARDEYEFLKYLKKETKRTPKALKNDLEARPDDFRLQRLRTVCDNDENLIQRLIPFAELVRDDESGYPVVIPAGSVFVTEGTDRRSSGTHYTRRSLTEPIVQYTLEPLLYPEIPEGKPKEESRRLSVAEVLELKICDMAMGSGAFLVQACRFLGDYIVQRWADAEREAREKGEKQPFLTYPYADRATGRVDKRQIPAEDEERQILAQRLVAEKCLYGVDKNPMAVEMAKLSLWLITMDKNRPFTFLDHALKCGDSLLGAHNKLQIDYLHIAPETFMGKEDELSRSLWYSTDVAREAFRIAREKRQLLESYTVNDIEDRRRKEALLREADEATDLVRLVADLMVGAAISTADGNSAKRGGAPHANFLNERRYIHEHVDQLLLSRDSSRDESNIPDLCRTADELLHRNANSEERTRRPFHWPVEFPEVFMRKGDHVGGFDTFIGNPPFMGGQKITGQLGTNYRNYCVDYLANGKKGSADLCAYFFLRARQLLRTGGMFGLLATNTIGQGDTREVGLDQLAESGCVIPRAVASRKWPGDASLEVAHVWIYKGDWKNKHFLDDRPQMGITTFLTKPGAVTGKPFRLAANANKSFQGSIVLGMGFVLTPEDAAVLIEKDPRNKDVLFPYLNGEDLNSRPDQSPRRCVINFFDWPLNIESAPDKYDGPVAAEYPDCLEIVEKKVKPERMSYEPKNAWNISVKKRWWQFGAWRKELATTIAGMERVLVRCLHANMHSIASVSESVVFSHALVVFSFGSFGSFTLLQSGFHECWSRRYSSSLRTDMRYSPTDCFETFPFPVSAQDLASFGQDYCSQRSQIMLARQEGLTKTCNRFHDPKEAAEDIVKLRELHVEMDYAVAAAYGWTDLDLGHGFHETKQGIRYTVCEEARREVLDRLLTLNHERYAEEVKLGLHEKRNRKGRRSSGKRGRKKQTGQDTALLSGFEGQ